MKPGVQMPHCNAAPSRKHCWMGCKPSLPAMPTVPGQARWTALLHQAHWALKTASEEMEDYAAARSENWQESERGEEFAERLAAFQEVMDALEELTSAPEKT